MSHIMYKYKLTYILVTKLVSEKRLFRACSLRLEKQTLDSGC